MNTKKIITKILIAMLIVCAISLASVLLILAIYITDAYNTPDEMMYRVNDDKTTCTVTGAINPDTHILRIPKEIDGYTVTQISDRAFSGYRVKIAIIPDTVSKIGQGAFYKCEYLLWVNGLDKCTSLTEIEKNTFYECSLLSIKLPQSIEVIDKCAFLSCIFLGNITIPSSVSTIGPGAFITCSKIEKMNVPASVIQIGERAFAGCIALSEITVDEANPYWRSVDGVLYNKEMTLLHSYPAAKKDESFVIPDGVTTILDFAFAYNQNLKVLEIPDSVISIGSSFIADFNNPQLQLHTINYNGTIAMWNSIEKAADWDALSPDFTIYCTDGTIAKDGTVTYN